MKRVTIVPSHRMALFGPRITIVMKDGRSYTKQARAASSCGTSTRRPPHPRRRPGLPISAAQFDRLIATCRDLDRESKAATLVGLTLKQ